MKTLSFPILVLMILMCFPNHLPAQEIPKIRPVFGVRYSANFDNLFLNDYGMDYWVLRSTPGLFLEYKNHDFQIGPANAHFINSPGWLSSTKLKNAMGFSFGYRYYPNEILKRMRMYAQLQVSQFWVKYTSHSLGSGSSEHKETAWCGYTSLGIDYRIYQRFHAFTGIGIGISSTFHNIFSENFYPHVMAGIDYRFGCLNKKWPGWVEIPGCGMVNPNVLKNCGIDPEVYSGFAFGIGVERITNLVFSVKNLRMFSENDVRFLQQFESAWQ